MKTLRIVPVLLSLFLLVSCSAGDKPAENAKPAGPSDADAIKSVEEVKSPAPTSSGEPNLTAGANGKTYLSWIESDDKGASFVKFSVKTAQGWSEARTIAKSFNMFTNWADFPSMLELPDGSLAAHWQETQPDADEGYSIKVALSKDEGKTWSKPVTPHRDGPKGEHGFVSIAPAEKGVSVIWLDSRKAKSEGDDYALMQTTIGLDGKLSSESEVDPRVCECCQPTAIAMPGGLLAVYRDRTKDEIRDIVVSRFEGGKWSEPKTVFDDKWMINACPIQGPAVSNSGENVAVAWFTAPNDKAKIQVALSKDGGKTFAAPVQVDDGDPVGRVGVATLDSGGAIVTSIEKTKDGAEVRARYVNAGGEKHPAHKVATSSVATSSGFPRIKRSGADVVVAWTDTEAGQVKTAVLKP
jgi:hypothetical protein